MSQKYSIGIDYGTESGRVLLVDLRDGREVATHVTTYAHGVISDTLPGTTVKLGPDWALQHPGDYLEVLYQSVPEVLRVSGVRAEDVVGIGVDFTTCTMLPVDERDEPLCFSPEYGAQPHSWVKLWKHHAAQGEADRLNQLSESSGEKFLSRYGGRISSEWMIPKLWQSLREAPEVYAAADVYLEAVDWIVARLSGRRTRNACTAGFKSLWHKEDGYPSETFLEGLDVRLRDAYSTKLRGNVSPLGAEAGGLVPEMAERLGLLPGTPVAVGIGDAHAAVPGVGAVAPGQLVMAMGTSICHMLLSDREVLAEGICGVVEDGIVPGFYAYEAGQAAVGDIFAWYVEHALPASVTEAAAQAGVSLHQWLERKAEAYRPGETGLLALDWWNGNRSVLVNANLSGIILGLTLQTKPEEVYRALLEATAFGTRKIIDAFEHSGLPVREIYACGGLPQKNELLMQIYADVTNREIKVADSTQTAALGAAIYGAVAAGSSRGGYDSIQDAAKQMARVRETSFRPCPERAAAYQDLYREYLELHDYFGRGGNDVMMRLKSRKS